MAEDTTATSMQSDVDLRAYMTARGEAPSNNAIEIDADQAKIRSLDEDDEVDLTSTASGREETAAERVERYAKWGAEWDEEERQDLLQALRLLPDSDLAKALPDLTVDSVKVAVPYSMSSQPEQNFKTESVVDAALDIARRLGAGFRDCNRTPTQKGDPVGIAAFANLSMPTTLHVETLLAVLVAFRKHTRAYESDTVFDMLRSWDIVARTLHQFCFTTTDARYCACLERSRASTPVLRTSIAGARVDRYPECPHKFNTFGGICSRHFDIRDNDTTCAECGGTIFRAHVVLDRLPLHLMVEFPAFLDDKQVAEAMSDSKVTFFHASGQWKEEQYIKAVCSIHLTEDSKEGRVAVIRFLPDGPVIQFEVTELLEEWDQQLEPKQDEKDAAASDVRASNKTPGKGFFGVIGCREIS